jgi:hypothetical protein
LRTVSDQSYLKGEDLTRFQDPIDIVKLQQSTALHGAFVKVRQHMSALLANTDPERGLDIYLRTEY